MAALLASWGYKVLSIDWDLDAPGLGFYFKKLLDISDRPGLLDLIEARLTNETDVDWRDYVTSVPIPGAPLYS